MLRRVWARQGAALASAMRDDPIPDDPRAEAVLGRLWARVARDSAPGFTAGVRAWYEAAMLMGADRIVRAASEATASTVGWVTPPRTPDTVPLDRIGHADLTGTPFSVRNPDAIDWLDRESATLVRRVDEETRDRIRTILTDGRLEGRSTERIARDIRREFPYMGTGSPLHHIDSRAHLIAVTETARAYERGKRMVADRMADVGLRIVKAWLTVGDGHVDALCADNEGAGEIPHDESFPSLVEEPPAHPGCRCTVLYRTLTRAEWADFEPPPIDRASAPFDRVLDAMRTRDDFVSTLQQRYGVRSVTFEGVEAEAMWGSDMAAFRSMTRGFERYHSAGVPGGIAQEVRFSAASPAHPLSPGALKPAEFSLQTRTLRSFAPSKPFTTGRRYGYNGYQTSDVADDFEAMTIHELGHGMDARWASRRAAFEDVHQATRLRADPNAIRGLRMQRRDAVNFREESQVRVDHLTARRAAGEELSWREQRMLDDHTELIPRYDRAVRSLDDAIAKAEKQAARPGVGGYVSDYASNNVHEDIAESITQWFIDPDHLRRTSPDRYRMVKRLLGLG